MIIVNQDKTVMVNFDNVDHIELKKLPVNEIGYAISIETSESYFNRFEIYDTEERAKEVLQEIIKAYREYRTAECDGYTDVLQETAVFEMPEE